MWAPCVWWPVMCSDCLQHCLTDDHCWCHRGQAPPPGDVTVTAPPPAEHLSHTDTRSDTGAGPDTCHTCAVKLILSHNIFCGTQDLSGDVSSGPLFLHLLLWLASLHPTPRCIDNGTKAFQKPPSPPFVALRLLSSVQADSSGYLSIIVLIPGEWLGQETVVFLADRGLWPS